jgi:hypothetical protein
MAKEKDAHEALSLIFHRDGVTTVMVMDGAKAQIQGGFRRKLREAGCHIKKTEIFSMSPGLRLPRPRARLPTHYCGAAFFPGGTKRIALPFLGLFLLVSILPTSMLVFPGPGSRAGVTPMILSLNLRNRAPSSGLVVKSPIMPPRRAPYD